MAREESKIFWGVRLVGRDTGNKGEGVELTRHLEKDVLGESVKVDAQLIQDAAADGIYEFFDTFFSLVGDLGD